MNSNQNGKSKYHFVTQSETVNSTTEDNNPFTMLIANNVPITYEDETEEDNNNNDRNVESNGANETPIDNDETNPFEQALLQ